MPRRTGGGGPHQPRWVGKGPDLGGLGEAIGNAYAQVEADNRSRRMQAPPVAPGGSDRPLMSWLTDSVTPTARVPSTGVAESARSLMGWLNQGGDDVETIVVGDDEDDHESSSELYSPTRTINPQRPRTREMSYNRQTRVLRVRYRSGGTYDYFSVPGPVWYRIRQVRSVGRFLNRNVIGKYDFEKVSGF